MLQRLPSHPLPRELSLRESLKIRASLGLWAFSGKDIFASVSGKLPFEIKDELICLYDFEDNYYEIDFEGKHIK